MTNAKLSIKNQIKNKKRKSLKSLEKKLLCYSIAAGAAITTTVENTQAVQYQDLGDEVIKNNLTNPFFLDFNEDNINDFSIIHSSSSNQGYNIKFSGASVFGQNANAFVAGENGDVLNKFEAGDLVDAGGDFVARGNFGSIYSSSAGVMPTGNFLGSDHAFFGVKFSNSTGTETFFGWGRVSMPTDGSQITLHDIGYNENAGESIFAGEGIPNTPVPEPGTLGMLALGAAGVITWRKRKDKLSNTSV